MHDEHLHERLSEYLDGGLDAAGRAACERHLAACDTCRATLADLDRVRAAARVLPAAPPARDLWPGIAARIAERAATAVPKVTPVLPAAPAPARGKVLHLDPGPHWWQRQFSFALPQAAAAALILVVAAGGGTWLALRSQPERLVAGRGAAPETTGRGPAIVPGGVLAPGASRAPDAVLASVDPRYDNTVAELQRVLATERARLDTSTVRILEQNLALIDRAVAEARRAVEQDPSNAYLRSHLASTMRRKVELLRRATVIPGAQG